MKRAYALAAMAMIFAAQVAHGGNPAVEAPIRQMEAAFNKGDAKAAKAAHINAPTIVDEVAPYLWSGPKAFDTWLGDLSKSEAAEGKTGGIVALGTPIRESIKGDKAYVVTPSTYTFKQKGKMMRETGTMTFALVSTKAGWKIQAWTWSSPEATPVD
jgi:hypothetical protein